MCGKLRGVLQHVLVDLQLVLDLLGKLRDLGQLVVDLDARTFEQLDELAIVGKLREFGCRAGRSPCDNRNRPGCCHEGGE